MPQAISNPEILELIQNNVDMLEALNAETEEFNRKSNELAKQSMKFVELMDAEYGFGNWHNVDAIEKTFMTREEINADKKLYVIANPAVRDKIETPINVVVSNEIKESEVNGQAS